MPLKQTSATRASPHLQDFAEFDATFLHGSHVTVEAIKRLAQFPSLYLLSLSAESIAVADGGRALAQLPRLANLWVVDPTRNRYWNSPRFPGFGS